jgi:hypothetical protein
MAKSAMSVVPPEAEVNPCKAVFSVRREDLASIQGFRKGLKQASPGMVAKQVCVAYVGLQNVH